MLKLKALSHLQQWYFDFVKEANPDNETDKILIQMINNNIRTYIQKKKTEVISENIQTGSIKNIILNIFGVDTFYGLEKVLDNMSPSLVEYHLSNFLDSDNSSYFDKKNIETTFNIGDYNLHIDYNDNIFIELNKTEENSQTLTFW